LAMLRIDVQAELRQFYGNVRIKTTRGDGLAHLDVVTHRLVGGGHIGDVFPETREHRAETVALQLRGRCERRVQILARHEAADRSADERQRRRTLPHPLVLRNHEKCAANYPTWS